MQKREIIFQNIAGYDVIKREATQLIDVLENTEKYINRGAHCPQGWLFYGQPGLGKTKMVKEMAQYLTCPIIEISLSDAITRDCTIQEDIKQGFAYAKRQDKAIIFIDELDKIAGYDRFEYNMPDNLNNGTLLLHEIDDIKGKEGIFMIATANKLNLIGPSLLRSGRFDRKIKFDYPTNKDRAAMIKLFMSKSLLDEDVSLDYLVKLTHGKSCSEIECIVNEAIIDSVSNGYDTVKRRNFNQAINRIAFKDVAKSNEDKSREELKLVAYHEAGHALMCAVLCPERLQMVSIVTQGGASGAVRVLDNGQTNQPHSEYLNSIKIGLAGMCSVCVMTGEMTDGNESDLQHCVSDVNDMLDEGFYGLKYVQTLPRRGFESSPKWLDTRSAKIYEILSEIQEEVEVILRHNKDVIERMANALLENGELNETDVMNIVAGEGEESLNKAC